MTGTLGVIGEVMRQGPRSGSRCCGQLGGLGGDLLEGRRGGSGDLVDHLLELSQHALDIDGRASTPALLPAGLSAGCWLVVWLR